MNIESPIAVPINYRITRASNLVLSFILCDLWKIEADSNHHHFLQDGVLRELFIPFLTKNLRTYSGRFAKELLVWEGHNLVPSVLRNSFATLISGTSVTPTFKANYMALGSSATAPANTDTQLGTETLRDTFTNRYASANVAYLDKFFSTAQVGGNSYLEAGVFVDGTGSANSGYLFSRVNINETMGVNETLTINASFTIT